MKINFIHALPHVMIDSNVKKKFKGFNNLSFTVPIAEWLEQKRLKARGRWFDSRRRHIFLFFYILLTSHCSQLGKAYINEIKA